MRARLNRQGQALGSRLPERGQRIRRGMMNNVNARPRLTAQTNHQRDGLVLSFHWARPEKRRILTRFSTSFALFLESLVNSFGNFRMHDENIAQSCQFGHRFPKIALGYIRKLVNARMNQEAFESEHACIMKTREFARVSRHDAAPEADIHRTLRLSRREFFLKISKRSSRRNDVEGHLDNRCDAARCRRQRRSLKALPLRPPRLVDVDVRVYESGHDDRSFIYIYHLAP